MKADTRRRLRSVAGPAVVVMTLAVSSTGPARALEFCASGNNGAFTIPVGETRQDDIYTGGKSIDIDGILDGDLIGGARDIRITGEVTGDMFVGAEVITIQGRVGDSVRAAGNTVNVQGVVDGDLLVFAEKLVIGSGATVTGDVFGMVASATVEGTVEGDFTGGSAKMFVSRTGSIGGKVEGTVAEFELRGTVGGDVRITADTLTIDPAARIGGDLVYTSRQPLDELEGMDVVAGNIEFEEKIQEQDDEDDGGWSVWSFMWLLCKIGWSLLTGWVVIAIFRKQVPSVLQAIEGEPLPSFGVGFVLGVVLPVAALIAGFLVVTIPLSVISLWLWVIGLYFAKLPVAAWIGNRVLRAAGSADPSPYLALLIGIVPLYIVFEIPFLGFLVYWGTVFLGFGAMFLGGRAYIRSLPGSGAPGAPATQAAPSVG